MAAKRRTAKRMESQSMGAASRRMSRSQAKERRQDEKRERKQPELVIARSRGKHRQVGDVGDHFIISYHY